MQEDCLKKERKKRFMATRIENPLDIHDYMNKLYKHTCNKNFKSME